MPDPSGTPRGKAGGGGLRCFLRAEHSHPPGWRSRSSKALFREVRSCCRWLVLSRQYFRSSTAGFDSGKSASDTRTARGTVKKGAPALRQARVELGEGPPSRAHRG